MTDRPGVEHAARIVATSALARATVMVEEEDETAGVLGRGRKVDRIFAALTSTDRLAIAGITAETLSTAMNEAFTVDDQTGFVDDTEWWDGFAPRVLAALRETP